MDGFGPPRRSQVDEILGTLWSCNFANQLRSIFLNAVPGCLRMNLLSDFAQLLSFLRGIYINIMQKEKNRV